jgi:hypothetical protein
MLLLQLGIFVSQRKVTNMAKEKSLQVRIGDEEEKILNDLTELYGIDRSTLIRFALQYINEEKPVFQVAPLGKELALAA